MRVLVTIPNTGWIHKCVAAVACRLLPDPRYQVTITFPTHTPYENNLHHIVRDMVRSEYDFWLNIDSDNPPIENPLDLVEFNLDIIGLPTPVWHYTGKKGERPLYYNAYDRVGDAYREHETKQGLQAVDAVGTGCILIASRVFQNQEMRLAPFQRQWNSDGTVHKGNDISFCERAIENGFGVWCHYDYPCRHLKELELNEVVMGFRGIA